ncbi:MAG: TAXI family TRAP transporter solute-binding subunit [Desulfobacterales bacterium]|nr:TAXI family TRAP transporter solute-binding subunit [Desulfobacterales bacterium]
MISRFRFVAIAIAVSLLSAIWGLSPAIAKTQISIGSCPVGCTAFTWSAGIADIINKNVDGVQVTAEETKGYVANVKLLNKGDLEASMATTLSSFGAYKATGIYKGDQPGQILSWLSIAPVAMHVITLDDGSVKTLSDLKGKRVGMGQPGGVSMLDADALMEQLGLTQGKDFKDFRVRLGNMADMLADGNLDAAIWNGSFPLPPVIKLTAQHKVNLLPISDDFYNKLREKYPPYFRISIPAGTYKGIDTDTPSYGLGNALIIHAKVPEDLVYEMTKAIMTNLDRLKAVHPAFGRVNENTILNGFGAPLHPGALRYYREVGIPGIEEFVKRTSAN